ncbi:phenylcoumaran benzylic ether reductase Betv6-like [Aristolochia californica]|uniref:phenylcoumaran benzylic ether reductase Betv6-like n=1 Tax=Aristolochia californica TaxID=171875 RepID=UPI0035D9642C
MAAKSRILVIGSTGRLGKFMVEASAKLGHPTFALLRDSAVSHPEKAIIIEGFKNSGVSLLYGDLHEHQSLVKAIKQVDVVISTVDQLADQVKIVNAIKEAGTVKRFLPSEFGMDVDRVHAVDPAKTMFETKVHIRRIVEAEGIPYTYVSSNFLAGYFLPSLFQPDLTSPPRDKVTILGDGRTKAIFVHEEDVAAYTISSVDDPRTLNKILYMRPPANIFSMDELVSLWEKKIGKTLERIYVSKEEVHKRMQESPRFFSLGHTVFVKGDQTNFEIEPSFGVEAANLYPEIKYSTVDELLNQFV